VRVKLVVIDLELPPWLKRWVLRLAIPAGLVLTGAVAWAASVHSWTSGETLKAQDLNDSFTAVQQQITSLPRVEGFHVACHGTNSAILGMSDGAGTTIVDGTAAGTCTLVFPTGMWSAPPFCTCTGAEGGIDADRKCQVGTTTTTQLKLAGWVGSAAQDLNVMVTCAGH
jgi:hypothetical protein